MEYKKFDHVRDRYGKWEGYIETIVPDGRLVVKTKDGYEWVTVREVEPLDGSHVEEKLDREKFRYLG